ncbi:MAG TPA: DUF502 domain-containing protein [Dehalococcoidia bacterium]|nr:DUF502 domain-containing protein [Dehalococcoidia bacterium]
MEDGQKVPRDGLGKKLRAQFIAGLLVVVPLGASVLILIWIFNGIDNILQPIIRAILGRNIPGVGFGITVILIYLAGVVASNIIGRKLISYWESLLARVPVFRQLYSGIKQILDSFSAPRTTGFMQVVLVEFPRKGLRAIGFVTNELSTQSGEKLYNVFIPTAPNPTSGFLEIVREEDMVRTKIPVNEALKMVVSAGRVSIREAGNRLP